MWRNPGSSDGCEELTLFNDQSTVADLVVTFIIPQFLVRVI